MERRDRLRGNRSQTGLKWNLLIAGARMATALAILAGIAAAAPDERDGQGSGTDLRGEYLRLRTENAILRARLSLSKQLEPYLILDIPGKQMRLELQGVTLVAVPIRQAELNRLARGISRDTTHIQFCEVPFVLKDDQWFEDVRTLALKDSSAVMSRPDTTGTLVEQIRKASVLSILSFDRNLEVVMDGNIPASSRVQRWKKWFQTLKRSFKDGTPEWRIAHDRRRTVMVRLEMDPAGVRTLAPNLTEGTKLILQF